MITEMTTKSLRVRIALNEVVKVTFADSLIFTAN